MWPHLVKPAPECEAVRASWPAYVREDGINRGVPENADRLIGVSNLDYIEALVAQIRGRSYSKQAVVLDDQDSRSCWQARAQIGRSLAIRLDSFTVTGHRRNLHGPLPYTPDALAELPLFRG